MASKYGRTNIVDWLITRGVDVNEKTNHGSTALHAAAAEEHYDICKVSVTKDPKYLTSLKTLLENGSRQVRDFFGSYPADEARGHLAITLLLENFKGAESLPSSPAKTSSRAPGFYEYTAKHELSVQGT